MIELKSSKSKSKFMEHVGVASWFRRLCNAQSDFAAKERIVWVDIEGVPLNAWTRSTFQKISSKWGELVELEDGEGFFGLCKELFVGPPSFKNVPEKELVSNDESLRSIDQAIYLELRTRWTCNIKIFLKQNSVRPPSRERARSNAVCSWKRLENSGDKVSSESFSNGV
ncbi:hypothetical protein Tco_0374506 [Tanacetum coccineum]